MKTYDVIILGFGKAGKTLAKTLAKANKKVAMIESSAEMYGGTCINIGCIPSKTLVHEGLTHRDFSDAMRRKQAVVSKLNQKNFTNLEVEENIDIYTNRGVFKSNKVIALFDGEKEVNALTAEIIVINTGATPIIPDIPGVKTSKYIYDSTGIMNLSSQPKRLVIVGGGYIALEFASMFANFNTDVTIIEKHQDILPREDKEVVEAVKAVLMEKGIKFVFNAEIDAIEDQDDYTIVKVRDEDYAADAVLLATGRKPNSDLNLNHTDIQVGERGEIIVNEHLETTVKGVYAAGDVKGGLQFTYISLDDFRILKDQLLGEGKRTTNNRGVVPYTVFIDPPLSRVGMTFSEASQKYDAKENTLYVNQIPRHMINHDDRGIFKVVVDASTHEILGATLFGLQSEEMINLVKMAIDQKLPYEKLRDAIYTHPTMIESFNDLFNF